MLSQSVGNKSGKRWRLIAALWLASLTSLGLTVLAQSPSSRVSRDKQAKLEKFTASIEEARAEFGKKIEAIAKYCDDHELKLEAEEVRRLAKPLDPNLVQGKNLPRQVQLEIPATLPAVEKKWRQDLRTLQVAYAAQLFKKAKISLDTGRISLGYELVREVARHDPDHKFARALLGYKRYENEWVTNYAESMLKKKFVLTEEFGWLKADQKDRYENGERFYNGEWITAQKETELRRDFKKAWVVRTDHYLIHTNHSLEMGVQLGKHLEDFYQIFFQTFAGILTSKENLATIFKGGSGGAVARPFVVHYYRTKQEYIDTLKPMFSQPIDGTTGLYLSGDRAKPQYSIAHFFHDPKISAEDRLATMFHEASHQLFSEAYASNDPVGVNSDFWAIEGIACYMESFHTNGETYSLGNPQYIRFQNAQSRLLGNEKEPPYFMPLQRLCSLNLQDFQADPNLSKNYSQGAGLSHFFLHYEDGIYREAFIAYLADIYSDNPKVRAQPRSLEQLTDQKFSKLDQQYRDYITGLQTEETPQPAGE